MSDILPNGQGSSPETDQFWEQLGDQVTDQFWEKFGELARSQVREQVGSSVWEQVEVRVNLGHDRFYFGADEKI